MDFNNKILSLRQSSGLSQENIAKAIGVTRSAISEYETGKSRPDYEKLVELANFFHVTTDYLLCRSERSISVDTHFLDEEQEHVINEGLSLIIDIIT